MNIETSFNGENFSGFLHGHLQSGVLTVKEYSFEVNDNYSGLEEKEFFKELINCTEVVILKGANIWAN